MSEPIPKQEGLPEQMFVCTVCGWLYEEDQGLPDADIPPGTCWKDVPEDFICPECGVGKDQFRELKA